MSVTAEHVARRFVASTDIEWAASCFHDAERFYAEAVEGDFLRAGHQMVYSLREAIGVLSGFVEEFEVEEHNATFKLVFDRKLETAGFELEKLDRAVQRDEFLAFGATALYAVQSALRVAQTLSVSLY